MDTEKFSLNFDEKTTKLSRRELEALVDIYDNKTAKESGQCRKISPRTVEFYRHSVKLKLDCRTKSDIRYKTQQYGWESVFKKVQDKTCQTELND